MKARPGYLLASWMAGVILLTGQARADRAILWVVYSLEPAVERSQTVVRGTVTRVAADEDRQLSRVVVTIRVEEVLRGYKRTHEDFEIALWPAVTAVPKLGDEVLAFSVGFEYLIILNREPEALTKTLDHLTDRQKILALARQTAARATAARSPDTAPSQRIWIPASRRLRALPDKFLLEVPGGPWLEKKAQGWLADPDPEFRMAGITAILSYRSAENVVRVKRLLDDTGVIDFEAFRTEGQGKWKFTRYELRDQAFHVLATWGIAVPSPQTRGPLLTYRPVRIASAYAAGLAALLAIPLSLAAALALRRRRALRLRRPGRLRCVFRAIASTLCLLAVMGIAGLWIRSRARVDEVVVRIGADHHELAAYGNGLQYMLVKDWRGPSGLLHGRFARDASADFWSLNRLSPATRRGWSGFLIASGTTLDAEETPRPYRLLRIPYWAIAIVLMIGPLLHLRILMRNRRRLRTGLCMQCGYDLRASPERCPECGWERVFPPRHGN